MNTILKTLGIILIAFGLIDLIGSFAGLDVWTEWINISLPELIWMFTAYIEIGLGYFLLKLGSYQVEEEIAE